MDSITLHLLSCHVPFVGGLFALGLLALGLARRQPAVLGAADLAVVVVALLGGLAWATGPAALTGLEGWIDPAAEAIADRHATLGDFTLVAWVATGLLALWGFFLERAGQPSPRWRTLALMGAVLFSVGLAAWAGHEGARIRHAELRHGAATPATLAGDAHELE